MKKPIVFIDMDGTLVFGARHGVLEKAVIGDKALVGDTLNNSLHSALKAQASHSLVYLGEETKDMLHALRQTSYIVISSGARQSTLESRSHMVDFADAYVLEGGGIIQYADGSIDKEWNKLLDLYRKPIDGVVAKLERDGWSLDIEGRKAGVRIRRRDNLHKTGQQFKSLYSEYGLPEELKKTRNGGHIDFIPNFSGKGNSARYLMEIFGCKYENSCAIGDDYNDLSMLLNVREKYVMKNSCKSLVEVAKQNSWNISDKYNLAGINNILNSLVDQAS